MQSKILALVGVAAACLAAAGMGAWLAVRGAAVPPSAAVAVSAPASPMEAPAAPLEEPAAGTEGVLNDNPGSAAGTPSAVRAVSAAEPAPRPSGPAAQSSAASGGTPPTRPAPPVASARERPVDTPLRPGRTQPVLREPARVPTPNRTEPVTPERADTVAAPAPVIVPAPEEAAPVVEPAPKPEFRELVVPVDSVIGLRLETAVRSATARVEDKVEAVVTRSVRVDGLVAIPADSRAEGSVILVERGGKFKERARIGVRFHTLALADGTRVPIQTDAVYREGESPAGSSTAKVGGAAVGGAILGAIFGGGKGAAIGGSIGAASGTAAVMAGSRSEAVLPTGTAVTVRLTAPVTVTVER